MPAVAKPFPCKAKPAEVSYRGVVGPLVFLLHINDLADLLANNIFMFANDVKLIYSCSDLESLKHNLSLSWA